ncbi:hypothetical protein PLICRDRAFT_171626 [Plicaturopsis crispa FD-325 SS-3]|nr:hypothetical protein PLICRDRAFT_171626 [Plicaturopsis crispa FD-325 SS-3]
MSTETAQPEAPVYNEKPTIHTMWSVALRGAGVGLFASAVQNAVSSHNAGGWGILSRGGQTVGLFAAMGAAFAFTDSYVANQRRKDDYLNGAAGGCAAGFLAGIRARSLPMAVTSCAVLGAAVGTYDYAGQLTGAGADSQEDKRRKFFKRTPPPLVERSSD